MAVIGQPLTAPEAGWTRVESNDVRFTKVGVWSDSPYAGHSGGSAITTTVTASIKFSIKGTGFRIIIYSATYTSANNEVFIDGSLVDTFNGASAVTTERALMYEKVGLDNSIHDIEIKAKATETNSFTFDAVDIPVEAVLTPFKVRDNLKDMGVGDRIICRYTATSGAFGTFSELGTSQATLIPAASSATPNGAFYFICVGKDNRGRLKLIADRNIQHSISWDVLNTAMVATAGGRPLTPLDGDSAKKFNVRLLTGGVSSTDKDNEWDAIIVGSTLNGTITAGDNAVWHWSDAVINTWTSTVASTSANRVARGTNTNISNFNSVASSTVDVYRAFRPVLLVELPPPPPPTKFLIQDGTDIKTYSGGWQVVGQAPATEAMFLASGMLDPMEAFNNIDTLVSNDVQILYYATNLSLTPAVSLVPAAKLVMPAGDLRLDSVEGVDHFTLTATKSGAGKIRLIASPDGGVTWYTYSGGWVVINPDVTDVGTGGMTVATFNSLTTEWDALLNGSTTIRFAYYIEVDATTDVAETDALIGQFDMTGWWEGAVQGVHYNYRYTDNKTLRVLLYADGSYKINYSEGVTA